MSKVAVIYKSKYGATKKYAEWLSEDIEADPYSQDKCKIEILDDYDTIIYGGGIYGSRIAGLSLIKKNYNKLKNKNIIVFMVGASPYDEKAYIQLKEHNFSDELKNIKLFYLRGMFDLKSMSFRDKFLIGMLKGVLSKKDPDKFEPWEKAFIESMDKAADWTSRENLKEIEDYINESYRQSL
jgi:flavodoxin